MRIQWIRPGHGPPGVGAAHAANSLSQMPQTTGPASRTLAATRIRRGGSQLHRADRSPSICAMPSAA
ncbi:MAG: hypothetical protein ACR2MP_33205 [Streptosporangiaceae bacterium]